jgi:hypothetical protein
MENRWWEYYVVRYFVGAVLGAVIVLFLISQEHFPLKDDLATLGDFKDSTFLGVSLVAAMGFAFCYVASSPILTVHATRAHLRLSLLKYSIGLFIPIAIVLYFAWRMFSPPVALATGLIVGTQIGLVAITIFGRFSDVEEYYRKLASARSKASTKKDQPASSGGEYVTSYRHLREHGNAFGILLLELVLAGALYELHDGKVMACWLVAWLFPAPVAWVIGTALESRFVSSPLP